MASTAAEEGSLEYTPTWIVAVVCSVIVFISLTLERILHYLGKFYSTFRVLDLDPACENMFFEVYSLATACEIVGVLVVIPPFVPAAVVSTAAVTLQRRCRRRSLKRRRRSLKRRQEMSPKIDVALDTSNTPKSENLPVQVTSIRLNKDNYLSWSATLEIGITSRGRLPYITGEKPAPSKTDPQWATWALEDSQVKVWIISSVFADIQPLILRKSTSYDMWTVLARMYGRKKRVLRTFQIKRNIYSLKQGDLSVASFYAALKTKWEELDYHVNDD
ncbi:hypothetical protein EJ110_NYTH39815 [Nymphaea thermarum]|nr:hypothetical protein EJ110_NYTH39815 [Nymphaea thermarum]